MENILLFGCILLIPTQLGKHFWPEWSTVMGVRVDYLSPTLYLIDLVWSAWIGLKILRIFGTCKKVRFEKTLNFQNIIAGLFVVVNILAASNRWVALYKWLRVGQWLLTFYLVKNEKTKVKKFLWWAIPIWVISETLLGIGQVTKGGSIEGWWYWLGERRFTYTGIGVAQISWMGQGLVRAYGTFSHPNSLAGFLLVVLCWWTGQKVTQKVWWWLVFWTGLVGIIISGSRIVWLLTVGLVIFKFWKISEMRWGKKMLGYTIIGLGMVLVVMGIINTNYQLSDFVGGWDTDSAWKRMALNWSAMKMWKENFVLGVGLGNFTSRLPSYVSGVPFYWWQPVHNVFLLWATETGILGVLGMVWLVSSWWRRSWLRNWKSILVVILVTAMMDHYWMTLPQNSWLLVFILGVM